MWKQFKAWFNKRILGRVEAKPNDKTTKDALANSFGTPYERPVSAIPGRFDPSTHTKTDIDGTVRCATVGNVLKKVAPPGPRVIQPYKGPREIPARRVYHDEVQYHSPSDDRLANDMLALIAIDALVHSHDGRVLQATSDAPVYIGQAPAPVYEPEPSPYREPVYEAPAPAPTYYAPEPAPAPSTSWGSTDYGSTSYDSGSSFSSSDSSSSYDSGSSSDSSSSSWD